MNTIRPAGVDVSMASVTDTKSMPSAANSSRARSRCDVLRANLSKRHTATTWNFPRRASDRIQTTPFGLKLLLLVSQSDAQ